MLHHVDDDGRPLWSCELPQQTESLLGLHQGRGFFARTADDGSRGPLAVELPGLDLAKEGWLTEWGDPEHRRRPRVAP